MFGFLKKLFSRSAKPPPPEPVAAEEVPEFRGTIGRYQVRREIGRGGMGVVLLAQDPFIERQVAIKTTKTPSPNDPAQFERFTRQFFHEARAVGHLNHPNIVGVYDALLEGDRCFLVMEYVDGTSLSGLIGPGKPPAINTVVKVGYHCAQALEYAHRNGVIHRDIKPANIMISRKSEVKISDFGIASIDGRSADPENAVSASVNYASPEQLRNEPLTAASDLFSLGVVMYELVTGRKPFQGESVMATIFKVLNVDPEPIKKYRPDCPDSLDRIITRLLDKNSANRHQTDSQLLTDLSDSFRHLRFIEEEIHFAEKFNAVRKLKFFEEFSTGELVEIMKEASWVQFEPAVVAYREGAPESHFYIIVTGRVLLRQRGLPLAELGPGDAFGELAGVDGAPQYFSAQAKTRSVVMKIGVEYLRRAAPGTQTRLLSGFNRNLSLRLAALGRKVRHSPPDSGQG